MYFFNLILNKFAPNILIIDDNYYSINTKYFDFF